MPLLLRFQDHRVTLISVIGLIWLVYAAFAAPAGLYTDDEVIYAAMIDRFASSGSFIIENGYDIVPAESLRLVLMKTGPHGLTPQYPAGYAILAAPFYLLGGLQGVIFLNALASVITLLLTFKIAEALFGDERLAASAALIFGLATFAVDYAFAIWPHAIANTLVAAAIFGTIKAREDSDNAWLWALAAGAFIGLGVTVRADVIIAAPVLFIWLFINAPHLAKRIGAFAGALAIGLILAACLNYAKFGIFHPLSYGSSSIYGYAKYLPLAIPAGAFFLSLRSKRVQTLLSQKQGIAFILVAMIAVVAIPGLRELAFKILRGLWVLIVDLKYLLTIDTHPRIENKGDYFLYYGALKKSLLQNLPWLGLLALSVVALFREKRKAAYALCLAMILVWFTPFAMREWVGGKANNLRYFTPVLPLLAILGAKGWQAVANGATRRTIAIASGIGISLTISLLLLWQSSHPELPWNQAFFVTGGSSWLGLAVLLLAAAWLLLPAVHDSLRLPMMAVALASFALAFVAGFAADAWETRKERELVLKQTEAFSFVEENAHVMSPGHFALYFQVNRVEGTLAYFAPEDIQNDVLFIVDALDRGRPVYIATLGLTRMVHQALLDAGYSVGPGGYSIRLAPSPVTGQNVGLYRITKLN